MNTCERLWTRANDCGHVRMLMNTCEWLWTRVTDCEYVRTIVNMWGRSWTRANDCEHVQPICGQVQTIANTMSCERLWSCANECEHVRPIVICEDDRELMRTIVNTWGRLWSHWVKSSVSCVYMRKRAAANRRTRGRQIILQACYLKTSLSCKK